jgi:hypothetical protein
VATSLNVSVGVIAAALERARQAGLDGSAAEGMDDLALEARLYGASEARRRPLPDPAYLTYRTEEARGPPSRADRHRWELDLDARTAVCSRIGHRQLTLMTSRLDVRPLAQETAAMILQRQLDDRLRWGPDGTVRVQIGRIIPAGSAVAQTLAGRRRWFWKVLDDLLQKAGWSQLRPGVYRPPAT